MEQLIVNKEPVPLYQALKLANLVMGGGEAKIVITNGYVAVNGEVAFEKRRKLFSGDVVSFNGEEFSIVFDPEQSVEQPMPLSDISDKPSQKKAKTSTGKQQTQQPEAKKGRKPISF